MADAVRRLQDAVDARLTAGGSEGDHGDLMAARAEANALREAQDKVSARLDAAIVRLHAILDE
ncbi:MAG: hypothetical protein KIT00_12640 [Rhodospirillales bacterium]|nr:hypothetical protein [Rhodospirillales bacterium]